jgi:oligoribonuclease
MADRERSLDNEYLLLVDIETTGLDPRRECMLELGIDLVSVHSFEIMRRFQTLVKPDRDLDKSLEPLVRDMHFKSGLVVDLEAAQFDRRLPGVIEAATDALDWLYDISGDYGITPQRMPMVGNNVPFDRAFLATHMPGVEAFFHYRNIDVSTLKELCCRIAPSIYADLPPKAERHRVQPDLRDTLDELIYYHNYFLRVD